MLIIQILVTNKMAISKDKIFYYCDTCKKSFQKITQYISYIHLVEIAMAFAVLLVLKNHKTLILKQQYSKLLMN